MYKRYTLFIISLLLSICIGYLVFGNYLRSHLAPSKTYVSRIDSTTVVGSVYSKLKYYRDFLPGAISTESAAWLPYTITRKHNSDGLNEEVEYPVQKIANAVRFMTIGDSFTYGYYVDTKDNFSEQLEAMLNADACPSEVINFGMPGFNLAYTLERYKIRGKKYNPDVIIWLLNEHNMFQVADMLADKIHTLQNRLSGEKLAWYDAQPVEYLTIQAQKEIQQRYSKQELLSMQKEYLSQFLSQFRGTLIVVMFEKADDEAKAFIQSVLKDRQKSYFFDGLPDLAPQDGLLEDFHPNTKGHTIIASRIHAYLIRHDIVQCNYNPL